MVAREEGEVEDCAIPGLRIETWGTHCCGWVESGIWTGLGSCYPTHPQKKADEWGTNCCGWMEVEVPDYAGFALALKYFFIGSK